MFWMSPSALSRSRIVANFTVQSKGCQCPLDPASRHSSSFRPTPFIIRDSQGGPLSTASWSRVLIVFALAIPALAQRDPVLKQIAEPHPYYFREMYLPQLTSGPSAAAWSP